MHYHELRQKAKAYNNIFHYSLGKSSFKSAWLYIATMSVLAMILFMIIYVLQKPFEMNRSLALTIAVVFEIVGIFSYVSQQETSRRSRLQQAGFTITDDWSFLDELHCQKIWLKSNIPTPESNYFSLVRNIDRFESELNIHKLHASSFFDRTLNLISRLPKQIAKIIAALSVIAAPVIFKSLTEQDGWIKTTLESISQSLVVAIIIGIPAAILLIYFVRAVAGAECNTVIELKWAHRAA